MNPVRWDSVQGAWATTTLREPAPNGLTAGKIRQPSRDGAATLARGQPAGQRSTRAALIAFKIHSAGLFEPMSWPSTNKIK